MSPRTPIQSPDKRASLGHPSQVWTRGLERRLEIMRRHVDLEGKRILDIGCGVGAFVRRLGEFSSRIAGIDVDAERVIEGGKEVPGLVLAEIDYFLREDRAAMRRLVAEIFDPGTRYEYELPVPSDIARALELDAKFSDLSLGLVDGTVAAVAQRRQVYRVLTTDRRDFSALRIGPRLTRALDLLP